MMHNRLHPSSIVPKLLPPYAFVMEEPSEPPPLAYTGRQPVVFNGPFQVIEPGSELYVDTEPNFCLELLPEEGLDMGFGEGLFVSENGIPAEVLEEAFRLDDEVALFSGQLPVPEGASMAQYEAQLVAEIERLFPEANNGRVVKRNNGSRLAEELTRKASVPVSNSPCYMNVFLKGGNLLRKSDSLPIRDTELGYRCVEMVDGTGATFKAKYYAEQMTATTSTPVRPSSSRVIPIGKFSPMLNCTTPTTPTRLPQLKNLTPSMASKIESLANGLNRNVTLTPVRTPSRGSLVPTSSSTIVIKAPKRTIASGNAFSPDPFFPMPMIKQEPLDESPPEDPLLDVVPVPVKPPPTLTNKQPRKQKLVKLSQNGEVVFNESTMKRKNVPAPVRAPAAANDGVTVATIQPQQQDISDPKKHLQRSSTPNLPSKPSPSLKLVASPTVAAPKTSRPSAPKRTRYRVHMTQSQLPQQQHRPGVSKRVPVSQTIESIEILDSSEDDEEETTTAPESSEPEDTVVVAAAVTPKLPGNTESIQCPYCCRIFRSSQAVAEHAQNCADACLFRQISKQKPRPSGGHSLLKGSNCPPTIATRRRSPEPQPATKSSRKTPAMAATKRSERLSIEILPSAFNIANLLLCPVCQKSFRTAEHLQQHRRIHQEPVVCEFCQKRFYETPPPKHTCQEKKRSMS